MVIALPTVGSDLDIPTSRQQWIVSAYSLTFGCFLLLWGRLADVYGKKLVFVLGSIWFCVVSLTIPFVPHEIPLDLLRSFQGLGAAATLPTAIGILGTTFIKPGKARNYAFSCFGAGAPLGAVFGNILGGFIVEYLSWKWIFWVHSIFAAMITCSALFVIPQPPVVEESSVKSAVDWIGGTLITCGLLALLFALAEGNVVGWTTPWIPVLIAGSVILVVLFVFWQWYLEKRSRRPLMKIGIFRNTRFSAAMIVMTLLQASFNNFLVFSTFLYGSLPSRHSRVVDLTSPTSDIKTISASVPYKQLFVSFLPELSEVRCPDFPPDLRPHTDKQSSQSSPPLPQASYSA
jgi:MFS family permease